MNSKSIAVKIIEALRLGLPPQRGVDRYSVGHEKLISGIKKFHLSRISEVGKIRFISGSWGAGKTHFFRLLRDVSFKHNCLVSNVELSVNEAPLSKFERVFYTIIRNVALPSYMNAGQSIEAAPFGNVVKNALYSLGGGEIDGCEEITQEYFSKACEKLMANKGIDIDFKKIIRAFWETYLPDAGEKSCLEQTRAETLQWFAGEGTVSFYKKQFGVSKMVARENAKPMLQALAEFVKLAGYKGLVILFDEAEQSYSIMRRTELKKAHINLLSLINSIEELSGMFFIYATTPDFYNDPKHGIIIYGALSGRIGQPGDSSPKAFQNIWNLNNVSLELKDYREAAKKIRGLYLQAYPSVKKIMLNEKNTAVFVNEIYEEHPEYSGVRFWRVLVSGLVRKFDELSVGEDVTTDKIYHDVISELKES